MRRKESIQEESPVEKQVCKVLSVETVKLCSLLSVLLNYKDNKKSQHYTFKDYTISKLGHTFTFLNILNTRYLLYLEAVAEVSTNLDFYIEYMYYL